jgi:methylase of polypeptide subunit release factors
MCESLCLADINPEAVEACRETIARHGLAHRVTVYRSDNLEHIPRSEKWDLVVGNPPHFADMALFGGPESWALRVHDEDWQIHRGFFGRLGLHLTPSGIAIIQENNQGSTPDIFSVMAHSAGLRTIFNLGGRNCRTSKPSFYFLGFAKSADVTAMALGFSCAAGCRQTS